MSGTGNWIATSGSAIALLVSGLSLWETVLKQPQVKVYVGDTISYTRDPWGSYEVFVVPITITNSGAQDGAVLSLRLDVANQASGEKDRLESTYFADANWWSGSDNVTNRTKRPKSPFAPLSIAGRAAWTGTILFYSPDYKKERVAEPQSRLSATLTVETPSPQGWIERLSWSAPEDIKLAFQVPNFLPGGLLSGDVVRLKVSRGPGVWAGGGPPAAK